MEKDGDFSLFGSCFFISILENKENKNTFGSPFFFFFSFNKKTQKTIVSPRIPLVEILMITNQGY